MLTWSLWLWPQVAADLLKVCACAGHIVKQLGVGALRHGVRDLAPREGRTVDVLGTAVTQGDHSHRVRLAVILRIN